MKHNVFVTSMTHDMFRHFGQRMVRDMQQNLPLGSILRIYEQGFPPSLCAQLLEGNRGRPCRIELVPLDSAAPWLRPFQEACTPEQCGVQGTGYNFRFDARKFACKVAAFTTEVLRWREPGGDRPMVVWMDADIICHTRPHPEFILDLMDPEAMLGWLDRRNLYPECGFVIVDTDQGGVMPLFEQFRDCYRLREVFLFPEWHDSWVLQHLVERARLRIHEAGMEMTAFRLTCSLSGPAGRATAHPFINGPLGAYFDHLKGPRKDTGKSRPTDLKVNRKESYWNE